MAKQARNQKPAKMPKMKIKKGDRVVVVAGKDRGREGQVIAAYPARQKVVVEGVNMIKKNTKVTHQGPTWFQAGRHREPGGPARREQRADRRPGHQTSRSPRLPAR